MKSKIKLPRSLETDSEYSTDAEPDANEEDEDDDPNFPLILPVHLCKDFNVRPASYVNRTPQLFAQPFVVVLSKKQAKSKKLIYEAVVDRLQRWVERKPDLFKWESGK